GANGPNPARRPRGGVVFDVRSAWTEHAVRPALRFAYRFQTAQVGTNFKCAAGRSRHLFARGAAAVARHDRRIPARCGSRSQHLSPSVALDFVGTKKAWRASHLSLK